MTAAEWTTQVESPEDMFVSQAVWMEKTCASCWKHLSR